MLKLIKAVPLLELLFFEFIYLFMAHLKLFHYLIIHNKRNQILTYPAQRDITTL